VEHVRRTDRVDIDLRALAGQPACCPGMVEVDVSQQHVGHITGREALGGQSRFQSWLRRAGSAFDQDRTVCMPDEVRGDGMLSPLEV
jgi:hypothetical protein